MESRAGRRLKSALVATNLALLAAVGAAVASVGPIEQEGVFALLGGTPKIAARFRAEHASGLTATLEIRQFTLDGKTPIRDYDIDMEKLMHLIVVRDDFATFAHVHPLFDATTGTFSQVFTKEPNHRYYVFADTTPRGIGRQVFRFTIESDGPVAETPSAFAPSSPAVAAGPYAVTLSTTTLPANRASRLNVTVLKNGAPARDLSTYLGAAAHAVFIGTSTLEYVHVHPAVRGAGMMSGAMSAAAMDLAGPLMTMVVPPLPAGTYKLWLEFRGSDQLYTAPFTMLAR